MFELFQELSDASNPKIKFVMNTHKKMPLIGLELIAPILCNLTEEIYKKNKALVNNN